ncbi:hypothetical protein [Marinobacterium litorale]|uniref:hypothetical protein n=1 Tax=Marinobacterium litorale TaxID=404770 RepID=UPI0012EBABD0|nr:hypothetical protein [Marinobacterium litorale]
MSKPRWGDMISVRLLPLRWNAEIQADTLGTLKDRRVFLYGSKQKPLAQTTPNG